MGARRGPWHRALSPPGCCGRAEPPCCDPTRHRDVSPPAGDPRTMLPCSRRGRRSGRSRAGRCGRCPGSGRGWRGRGCTWPGRSGLGALRGGKRGCGRAWLVTRDLPPARGQKQPYLMKSSPCRCPSCPRRIAAVHGAGGSPARPRRARMDRQTDRQTGSPCLPVLPHAADEDAIVWPTRVAHFPHAFPTFAWKAFCLNTKLSLRAPENLAWVNPGHPSQYLFLGISGEIITRLQHGAHTPRASNAPRGHYFRFTARCKPHIFNSFTVHFT